MITATDLRQIQGVLMNPDLSEIKANLTKQLTFPQSNLAYFTFVSQDTDENVTFLMPGKNGVEFNKTYGFFHIFPGVLIYRCIYGHGVVLIQKNDSEGEAKEIRVVAVRPGVEIEIPSGYGHSIINTGRTFLVLVDNGPKDERYRDADPLKTKHGLVYYVIDKKGEVSFEKNLNYSYHPQITT